MVEGVSDRVEFPEADARDLPFPSRSFDVVLSNPTFSNIRGGVSARKPAGPRN
jgi:ubiquinone/menaquinone biosynthesis C-methylase UbiE